MTATESIPTASGASAASGAPPAPAAPMPRAARRRTVLAWAGGLGLLAAAWGVTFAANNYVDPVAPFTVTAEIGEPAVGRGFEATFHDVRAAGHVTGSVPNRNMEWFADGTWIVVDLDVTGRGVVGKVVDGVYLTVGDRLFRASERPESLLETSLQAGIPRTGSLAFEVPPEIFDDPAADSATVSLFLDDAYSGQADSVIALPVDLTSLELAAEAALVDVEWISPK